MATPIGYNPDEQATIQSAFAAYPSWRCLIYDVVASTQDACAEHAEEEEEEEAEQLCVVASHQVEARGRRGSTWDQEPGLDLSLSLLLRPAGRYPDLLLPLLLPAALRATVLERLASTPVAADAVQLKWPNDLLVQGRKLAGVLIEACPPDRWIAGIGLNVNRLDFPPELAERATSLTLLTGTYEYRAELCAELLARVLSLLDEAERGDGSRSIAGFNRGLGLVGEEVELTQGGTTERGRLLGVTPDGVALEDGRCFALGSVGGLSASRGSRGR